MMHLSRKRLPRLIGFHGTSIWHRRSYLVVAVTIVFLSACKKHQAPSSWKSRPVDLERSAGMGKEQAEASRHTWKAPEPSPLQEPCIHVWPLDGLNVTSPYGHRMHPVVHRVLFHRGIDLASPRGTPVLATAQGVVEFAGQLPLTGNTVIVAHPDGTQSLYAHLEGILVYEGEVVARRAPVGLIGSTGRSTGPHLHFQLNRSGRSMDPTLSLERLDEAEHWPLRVSGTTNHNPHSPGHGVPTSRHGPQ